MKAGSTILLVIQLHVSSQEDNAIFPGNEGWRSLTVRAHYSSKRTDRVEWLIDWDPASNVCSKLSFPSRSANKVARELDVAIMFGLFLAVL
jgi:hypothetical protein